MRTPRIIATRLLLALLVLIAPRAAAAQQDLYLTGGDGTQLWKVDTSTGVGTLIGATGTSTTYAAAFGADGKLYTITNTFTGNARLATLDLNTGAATPIGPPFADGGMLMLETLPNGTMVGASLNTSTLYNINTTTGVATAVGPLGFGNVMDFAVNSAGELWAVNNTDLWKVNPATGASTHVVAIGPGADGCVMSIAFDAADQLFATNYCSGNSLLYKINTTTGALTVVGVPTGISRPHGGDIKPPVVDTSFYLTGGDGTQLWKVDTTTGAGTLIGPTGTSTTYAAAFGADGKLYTITNTFTGNARLATFDLNTGTATPIGPPFADGGMLMLETLPDGTMVGGSLNTSNLYKINPATGVATLVGNLGFGNVMDFAVNSAGELWAVNNTDLWKVNAATGASSHVVTIGPGADGCVMSIAFDAADQLFATNYCSGNSLLYKINTTTGALTVVGVPTGISRPHGGDIRSGAAPPAGPPPANLYLTGGDGTQLWKVNPTTGVGTLIGPTGTSQTWAAAFGPDGKLYTITNSFSGNARLATLDINTGAATPIGPPFADAGMLMLETLPNGTMVAASLFTSTLYRINLATGTATPIGGNMGFGNVMDLAANSLGELWAVNNTDLWKVDPNTGIGTHVVAIGGADGCVMSIAFDAADQLFATNYCSGNSLLYKIDTTTGAVTTIGPGTGIRQPHGGDFPSRATPTTLYVAHGGGNVGAPHGGEIGTIDLTTFAYTPLTEPLGSLTSLAFDGRALYTYEVQSNRILRIDPTTGAILSSAPLSGINNNGELTDLAYDPTTGQFYGMGTDCCSYRLYRVDVNTGVATSIGGGTPGGGGFRSIAFSTDGSLYLHATNSPGRFFKLDKNTGATLETIIGGVPGGALGLEIEPATGRLIASECCSGNNGFNRLGERLWSVDTTTGAPTLLFDYNDGRRMHDFAFGFAAGPNNQAPIADAGSPQTIEAASPSGASFTLDGSASTDPDGDTLTYEWSGAFGTASGVNPTVTLPPPPVGQQSITYSVMLMVDDGNGGTAMDMVDLTVTDTAPPAIAGIPADFTVEGNALGGANVDFGPFSASDSVDGDQLVNCSAAPGLFPLGTTEVVCSASDLHTNTATQSFRITVIDTTPPALTVPAPITVHASGPSGAAVTFAATALDTVWGDVPVVCTPASGSTFGLGTTPVNCTTTDGSTNSASGGFTVTVTNTAPTCNATPSVSLLWSPNHQLVPITITGAGDADGDALTVAIDAIRQDEPTNTKGDGNTPVDGYGVGTSTAQVRAERVGGGDGRVYHISFSVTDIVGASCSGVVKVAVPHDQGKGRVPVDNGPLFSSTGQ